MLCVIESTKYVLLYFLQAKCSDNGGKGETHGVFVSIDITSSAHQVTMLLEGCGAVGPDESLSLEQAGFRNFDFIF